MQIGEAMDPRERPSPIKAHMLDLEREGEELAAVTRKLYTRLQAALPPRKTGDEAMPGEDVPQESELSVELRKNVYTIREQRMRLERLLVLLEF